MKNCPVGAKMFMRSDGRTDRTKLIVAFRNFANAHKKVVILIDSLGAHHLTISIVI